MGTVALRLTDAAKHYGDRTVLDALDLDVARGGRLVVLGPSGSGKSTLLRLLAGLETLDGGELTRPDGQGAVTATVFQQPLLLPWLDVAGNVALGGRYRANRGRYDDARARDLLDVFGIAELTASRPDQLSGGQAQRVAIARAMAIGPDILLLDEPFGALDPATRTHLQEWLRDTVVRLGVTLVLVTHDVDEALYLGTTITALDGAGATAGTWSPDPVPDHDDLASHPLRPELLASYRSQVDTLPAAG
ncbi:ABC transporter ATP-binding protein [Pseudonocardia endophytica]|uniref:Sulfate transport system ATP-binding protein/sulfonate transport system ATP-binding protein n=1 Tax=Pseudonocardia endophytica TaxID=401976 RepID=A0A4R1HLR9_PSEEN|nr:ATP-binding cassette domain-containing protein [Pseudonocardia endophytica]TCK22051.1 sulfate transport system ATP-binding protein/sulfonate transport system ATP-binding protein [Pseudonocardia endophytica]